MKREKVLVTGCWGMLAGHLVPILEELFEVSLSDLSPTNPRAAIGALTPHPLLERQGQILALDITNYTAVSQLVMDLKPSWIINCAAYTAVDQAESQRDLVTAVNVTGPTNLASAAAKTGGKLLHISSDYVFGGGAPATQPIREDDPTAPCGFYGMTKQQGDESVLRELKDRALVVRTSWLHGIYGPNFVDTILRAAKERPELKVVNDQRGSPTWAGWLAQILVKLIERDASGIFHATSLGDITWFDFATEVVKSAGLSTPVLPQSSQELNRPAPRPPYSTLDTTKLTNFLGEPPIDWRVGVLEHLHHRS